MAKLPPTTIPDAAFELISLFAKEREITMAEAVRVLIQSSTELNDFAVKQGKAASLEVRGWGGRRIPKDVAEELAKVSTLKWD